MPLKTRGRSEGLAASDMMWFGSPAANREPPALQERREKTLIPL
jgi:hypothetical protein